MKPARNNWALYKWLLTYVRPYRKRVALGLSCAALFGIASGGVLGVVKYVWVWVFERGATATSWEVVGAALLLPAIVAFRGSCDMMQRYLMNWVGERVVTDLRRQVFAKMQTFSLDFFGERRTGELLSRVGNDVGLVQYSVSTVVEDLVKQPVTLLCVLVSLLYISPWLTLAVGLFFPLCILPVLYLGRRTRRASQAAQQLAGTSTSVLLESLIGWRVIKVFCAEDREAQDYAALLQQYFRQRMRVMKARVITTPMIELIAALGATTVFLLAYFQGISHDKLVPFALGVFMLYDPIKKLSRIHLMLEESLSGAERVHEILHQPASVVEVAAPRQLVPVRESIRFDNVTFQYDPDRVILQDIHLDIPAGNIVALVGSSGAGKTTLLNLVPRFMDPTKGTVRVDGQDIREVTLLSLRQQMGLVTQETFLFNDTVAANIAYAKPDATREEILRAAQRAHAHDFIAQLPQQYDTPIGETGMKLSGGQRQRLAIARAILKDPPILLLDEATSALDTESERAVQAALDELMWGETHRRRHTMLVIAHRLSTVQHADCIVVLDKGRVAQQGAHNELVARDGLYRRLYDLQFAPEQKT